MKEHKKQLSKKEQTKIDKEKILKILDAEKIEEVNIFDYCKAIMEIYGANVALGRVLSDVRDGLIPSERRILWSMFKDKDMKNTTKSVKSATIVGICLGNYHPQMGQN